MEKINSDSIMAVLAVDRTHFHRIQWIPPKTTRFLLWETHHPGYFMDYEDFVSYPETGLNRTKYFLDQETGKVFKKAHLEIKTTDDVVYVEYFDTFAQAIEKAQKIEKSTKINFITLNG